MPCRLAPLEQRFWQKVVKASPDECWLWSGTIGNDGYGQLSNGRKKYLRAHRVSWELANGCAVPADLSVCHTCDNPPCVNPDHLWVGTTLDNARDSVAKGRRRGGRPADALHCGRGHPYTPENTYVRPDTNVRCCRACRNIASTTYAERKAA